MLPQAGVEDEELCVSQPGLQLLNPSLQLPQQRVGEWREGRTGAFHANTWNAEQGRVRGAGLVLWGTRMLGQDFLEEPNKQGGCRCGSIAPHVK